MEGYPFQAGKSGFKFSSFLHRKALYPNWVAIAESRIIKYIQQEKADEIW
jgi:hypothetical protein